MIRPTSCECGNPGAKPPCSWCTDYAYICPTCHDVFDLDAEHECPEAMDRPPRQPVRLSIDQALKQPRPYDKNDQWGMF